MEITSQVIMPTWHVLYSVGLEYKLSCLSVMSFLHHNINDSYRYDSPRAWLYIHYMWRACLYSRSISVLRWMKIFRRDKLAHLSLHRITPLDCNYISAPLYISASWYQTSASPSSIQFEYQLQDWIVKDMGNDYFPQAIIVKIIKLMQMVLASFIMWSISKLEDLVVFRLYIVHTTVTWNICFNVSIRFPTS